MSYFVYIDNSNVWIEGQRVSAVRKAMSPNVYDAMEKGIVDPSFRLDVGKLRYFAGENDVKRAILFGSRPPENDSLWELMRRRGFQVIVEDRNAQNREKKIDTGIVYAMTKDAFTIVDKAHDVIVLIAGDKDYVPAVSDLVADGFTVEVMFWSHAARELRECACQFIDLDSHFEYLRLTANQRPKAKMETHR